jgi:hypothetical protein
MRFLKVVLFAVSLGAVFAIVGVAVSRTEKTPKDAAVDEESRPVAQRSVPLIERRSMASPAPAGTPMEQAQEQPEAAQSEPDRAAALEATLEAEYAVDARPTREAAGRESVLKELFSQAELRGKGTLEEVNCREKVCRGVIRMVNEQADNEVFGQTFLSPKFATAIRDAVTIASRKKMADGSVLATFFIYPQSVLDTMER